MANGEDTLPKTQCTIGIDNHRRIIALEKADDQVWKAIDDIRKKLDRLPVWGVALVSLLSMAAGGGISVAITLSMKLAN